MKLLLGFHWTDAVDYASERGWRVNHARHDFTMADGGRVLFCRGLPGDERMLSGYYFSEIIRGSMKVDERCDEAARYLLRPRAPATSTGTGAPSQL